MNDDILLPPPPTVNFMRDGNPVPPSRLSDDDQPAAPIFKEVDLAVTVNRRQLTSNERYDDLLIPPTVVNCRCPEQEDYEKAVPMQGFDVEPDFAQARAEIDAVPQDAASDDEPGVVVENEGQPQRLTLNQAQAIINAAVSGFTDGAHYFRVNPETAQWQFRAVESTDLDD